MYKVCIIVPIYNIERYLDRCINSILRQSYEALEIVLVDDGSTDKCAEICDSYARRDKRVIVIHKPNGGLISARLAGLTIATAPLVMFVDGDDWVEQNCVASSVEAWEADEVDLVCFGTLIHKDNSIKQRGLGSRAGFYSRADIENEIFPLLIEDEYGQHFDTSLWGKLFLKEKLISAYEGVDERITMGEDGVVTRPYVFSCTSMFILNQYLYDYNCENQTSMTHSLKPMNWNNARAICNRYSLIFSPLGLDWTQQVNRNTAHNLLVTILSRFNGSAGYMETSQAIKHELKKREWREALINTGYKSIVLKAMVFCMLHRLIMPIWIYRLIRQTIRR